MTLCPLSGRLAAALALPALLLAAGPARAQDARVSDVARTTSVPFLQIEPDSRAAGMGMANVAVADNASALFWNPAGLAGQEGAEVTFTHAPWLPELGADLFFEYLAGKYAIPGVGTVAGHLTFLNLGEQQIVTADGVELSTFRSYDLAVGASYGREIGNGVSVGVGLRYIYSNLASGVEDIKAGTAIAGDLGVLYRAPRIGIVQPSFGLNLANIGSTIKYRDEGEANPIPTNLRFGGALEAQLDDFNRITFAADFAKLIVDEDSSGSPKPFYEALFSSWRPLTVDFDGPSRPGAAETVGVLRQITVGTGLEYWYNDLFALRTGYFYEDPYNGNRQFLSFGAGVRYSLVGVDLSYIYALEENSPLNNQLRFSLMLNVIR